MTTSLRKRVSALEDQQWSSAEEIRMLHTDAVAWLRKQADALDGVMFSLWIGDNEEMAKKYDRAGEIQRSMSPIHPAFLPSFDDARRRYQWAAHHSTEFCELTNTVMAPFVAHVKATYDMAGGPLKIALQIYDKDIVRWQAQRDYIGCPPEGPDDFARQMISFWRFHWELYEDAERPTSKQALETLY